MDIWIRYYLCASKVLCKLLVLFTDEIVFVLLGPKSLAGLNFHIQSQLLSISIKVQLITLFICYNYHILLISGHNFLQILLLSMRP